MGDGLFLRVAVVAGGKGMTIRPIPDGDAMAPPELTADAPVADVFHPVEVGPLEALRDDLDFAVAHGFDGRLGQRLGLDPPLLAEQRLDHGVAALAVADLVGAILHAHGQPGGFACPPTACSRASKRSRPA